MITREAHVLGPQCLQCKKRRVKCDSTPPNCLRCSNDRFDCPGYTKATKWSVIVATKDGPKEQPPRRNTGAGKRPNVKTRKPKSTKYDRRDLVSMFQVPTISQADKDSWQVEHAVIYWNQHIAQDIVALPRPGQEVNISPQKFFLAPNVVHHIFVVLVANHRLAQSDHNALALADLYRRRGQALEQLHSVLEFFELVGAEASIGILAMMTASEIQMSAVRSWDTHLEAGKTLVNKHGGLRHLWHKWPELREACAFYPLMDVMSATTTPAHLLARPKSFLNSTQLHGMGGLDRWILSTCCPIPMAIFEAVAKINEIRWNLHHINQDDVGVEASEQILRSPHDVLNELLNFNAGRWAKGVYSDSAIDSEIADSVAQRFKHSVHAWASLAKCYQSATVIYFLRSIQSVQPHDSSQESREKFANGTSRLLDEHREALTSNLAFLFEPFENRSDSSSQHTLWNYVVWPLFIHAYDLVSQSVPNEHENAANEKAIHQTLRRMHLAGKALGARCLFDAVRLLHQVMSRRGNGQSWSWDDGFPGRCVFVV